MTEERLVISEKLLKSILMGVSSNTQYPRYADAVMGDLLDAAHKSDCPNMASIISQVMTDVKTAISEE